MDRRLLGIVLAQLAVAPCAYAEDEPPDSFKLSGSVGAGAMHTDDKSTTDASKLNEYRDLSSGLLTNFDVTGRSSKFWMDLFGENLGRDDEYVNFRGGLYDVFRYRIYTDALRHNFLFNGITPYAGSGSNNLTATFPNVNTATWNGLDLGYKRRDTGVAFEWQRANPWYARVDANQVEYNGTKPGSSSQGTSPGNGFVDLALPVDYRVRNATAEAGYNTRSFHADLSYMVSKFDNDNESITWTNGYFGNGMDRTYLPADNKYQRIAANASWRFLPWGTTLAARYTGDKLRSTTSIGDSILNGTAGQISPVLANTSTYEGRVNNDTFTISAASSPMKAFDTRVYYNYRRRQDESTQVVFTAPDAATTQPLSYKKHNPGFDAYYRLDRANRFGVGFDYLDTDRSGRADYDRTKDRRLFAEWKNSTLEDLAARLKYQRLQRTSNFLEGQSGANSSDPDFLNRFVNSFDLANVDQDYWKLTLDYTMMERLDLSFEGIVKNNRYRDNALGRLRDNRSEVYLTASYAFPNAARFTIFGDAEEIHYDSTHRIIGDGSQSGAYDPATAATAANYNWSGNTKDRNWAMGAAFHWPVSPKLALSASAIYYKTDGYVDLSLQEGVPSSVVRPAPIPAWDDSKRTSITLKGIWTLDKAWSLTGGYAYEKYEYSDSQFNGYQNVVTSSNRQDSYLNGVYANPQYNANIFYALVTYHF